MDTLELSQKAGVVLLLTDRRVSFGGDPCALAKELAATSKFAVPVVGFKVRARGFQWNGQRYKNHQTEARCLAVKTGGVYARTESTEELEKALQKALACPLFLGRKGESASFVRM